MSVYRPKNADGSYKSPFYHFDFVIKINGERCRVHGSTGETEKARAREAEKAERRRRLDGKPNDGLTLAAACDRYCDEVSASQPSAEDTEKALEHCSRLIGGHRLLINITADDIAEAVRRRAAETYGSKNPRLVAPGTVNRQIVEPLRRVMRRARRIWGVSCDPEGIDWASLRLKEPKGRVREFTTEESQAFWQAIREDYRPLTWFLAHRGFRVRAALAMEKPFIDVKGRRIKVWKKGEGYVWRPISASQAAVLSTEMKKAPQKRIWTYVVQRGKRRGERRPITYNGFRRVMENALADAGIEDFRIHDLRHDFASKLLRKTHNLALVRKALDHADISSTQRYAHVLDEDVADGMEALSRNSPGMATPARSKANTK